MEKLGPAGRAISRVSGLRLGIVPAKAPTEPRHTVLMAQMNLSCPIAFGTFFPGKDVLGANPGCCVNWSNLHDHRVMADDRLGRVFRSHGMNLVPFVGNRYRRYPRLSALVGHKGPVAGPQGAMGLPKNTHEVDRLRFVNSF